MNSPRNTAPRLPRGIPSIDLVIPCHNEEDVLHASHVRLEGVMQALEHEGRISGYRLIFVDNGSTDATLPRLLELFRNDAHVVVLSLRRNFGYQGSITAGLAHASSDVAVTVDADLQDPPEKIHEMLDRYMEGYDLVLGVREDRKSDSFLKRHTADAFYRLLTWLGVETVPHHGDFRLMARGLVEIYNTLPERHRLIRAMMLQLESRYATVNYSRSRRQSGYSKFNIGALFALALDGITSFSYRPLRLASLVGLMLSFASALGIAWAVYLRFLTDSHVPGWASTILPVFLMGGVQLLMLGVLGEYVGKLYMEVKQRPLFLVRDKYEHGPTE